MFLHYDPWGNQVAASGSLVQPMRYAGYYYDDETGLYYLKSRYYSPTLGRFLTRDSIGFINYSNPQTLNLYSYVANNPVSRTDPNGNEMVGDNKLGLTNSEKQRIHDLGSQYNAAKSQSERDRIHALADGIRDNARARTSTVSEIKTTNTAVSIAGAVVAVAAVGALAVASTPVIVGVTVVGIILSGASMALTEAEYEVAGKQRDSDYAYSMGVNAASLIPGLGSLKFAKAGTMLEGVINGLSILSRGPAISSGVQAAVSH